MAEPGHPKEGSVPQDAETLDEVLVALETEGFGQQLVPQEGGTVRVPATGEQVDAGELTVKSVTRLEGASDPDDMMLVAAVEVPGGGRGALVLGFGPNSSAADADVLVALNLPDAGH